MSALLTNPSVTLAHGFFGVYQNGPRAVVVVGHPESLHTLSMLLNEKETRKEDSLDQSRIPHSKRKHEFRLVYLPVSVPFHSQLLKGNSQRYSPSADSWAHSLM